MTNANLPQAGDSPKICSQTDCTRNAWSKGLCSHHYTIASRPKCKSLTDVDATKLHLRFWAKVDKRSADECWNWTARKNHNGYGTIRVQYWFWLAHVVAFYLSYGRGAQGVVRHTCDNPSCCNPHHLVEGTQAENMQDMVSRDRQAKGSIHGSAKLTEADIPAIRSLIARKWPCETIAKEFGVSFGTIYDIRAGRTWRHIG